MGAAFAVMQMLLQMLLRSHVICVAQVDQQVLNLRYGRACLGYESGRILPIIQGLSFILVSIYFSVSQWETSLTRANSFSLTRNYCCTIIVQFNFSPFLSILHRLTCSSFFSSLSALIWVTFRYGHASSNFSHTEQILVIGLLIGPRNSKWHLAGIPWWTQWSVLMCLSSTSLKQVRVWLPSGCTCIACSALFVCYLFGL